MASLGISPRVPSLLIPSNPGYSPLDEKPQGGILLNAGESSRRLSQPTTSPPARPSPLPSPTTPIAPTAVSEGKPSPTPRIRFAPLPDPHRPRSLSTGRNLFYETPDGMDAEGARHIEFRGMSYSEDEDDNAVAVDDEEDDDDEGGGSERDKRGRSWSKTMSWKGTKKLLTTGKLSKEDPAYESGAPLKKSVSTGGFIGSSPFRWTAQEDRRRSMQGLNVPSSSVRSTSPDHRRNSSLETGATPAGKPVKMLNGRVYGSRRASEIAELQKRNREKAEPAFVEWGHGKTSAGMGSNAPKPSGGGFLEEEGSGMEWVKRRREERQAKLKQEQEEAAARAASGSDADAQPRLSSSQSSNDSPVSATITPASRPAELPPTPVIQVSEHISPTSFPTAPALSPTMEDHNSQAINIGTARKPEDNFDEAGMSPGGHEAEDEDEDEEDDGDFSSDDDDDDDAGRTTATAAGIEVYHSHKQH